LSSSKEISPFIHLFWILVGHGKITNSFCNSFVGYHTCFRTDLHRFVSVLDGKRHTGEVFSRLQFNSCDRPSCPSCYRWGWAVRQARRIEERLITAVKKLGFEVEHVSVIFPSKYWDLGRETLKFLAIKALEVRGAIAGCLIPHPFRYRSREEARYKHKPVGFNFEFHFHALIILKGGYKCRGCKKVCTESCDGFEAVTRREWKNDEIIVEVAKDKFGEKGKRKSIYYTAWYQLTHSGYDRTVQHPRVVSYFGGCSYRNLKVKVEREKSKCEQCQHELEDSDYVGVKAHVLDRTSKDYKNRLWEPFIVDESPTYVKVERRRRFPVRHKYRDDENPTFLEGFGE
jgi:hypothetical protein